MPARRLGFGRKVGMAGLALGVALLLVELALRVWSAVVNPPMYELDERLGWRHACSVDRLFDDGHGRRVRFATDARGLRVTPHAGANGGSRPRVLVAGDSFTQGSQVEAPELFTSRIEQALGTVELWNAGVGGYSTLQELRALPDQLAACAPALVVLVVFENDFQDNLMPYFSGLGPRPHVQVRGGAVEVVERPDVTRFERFLLPLPGALWWYEHSALYRALHKHLFLPVHGYELAALEHEERGRLDAAEQRTAMAWLLGAFAATVRTADADLLVAAVPLREDARVGKAPSHEWLAARCGELQVPFVSLLAPLHAAPAERAYFAKDIHLTSEGHAVVAAALAPAIRDALDRRR